MRKLVRDQIPALVGKPATQTTGDDYGRHLANKLVEEALEFKASSSGASGQALREELGDVLEVFYALLVHHNITHAEIEDIRKIKHDTKGGFAAGYVMEIAEPTRRNVFFDMLKRVQELP
jgi:predicted house-cleaning noncanonical NTP pyrophosphatase (MazG superfamily)